MTNEFLTVRQINEILPARGIAPEMCWRHRLRLWREQLVLPAESYRFQPAKRQFAYVYFLPIVVRRVVKFAPTSVFCAAMLEDHYDMIRTILCEANSAKTAKTEKPQQDISQSS